MKLTLALLLLALPASALTHAEAERICMAIYRAEGGAKAKVPFGILSIKVKDYAEAKRVCINTVKANHKRWVAAGKPGDHITFLARQYCPPSTDPIGNRNWRANIKSILKQP